LPEGLHNLKLEVEDRAGNISDDYLFDLLVDRTPPVCNGAIHPNTDTGIAGNPGSFSDGVTRESAPAFTGTAEANSIVTLLIDGVPVGTTVALPFDGDDAFNPPTNPTDVAGNWELGAAVSLMDGVHSFAITCEDPAGNRSTQDLGTIVVDLQGPKVVNVTRVDDTSLFVPKPAGGPDPLIHSIVIHFNDGPIRTGGVEYGAVVESIATEEGNYVLVGDANGNIPIARVVLTSTINDDGIAGSQAELFFVDPLPDDRFTITVSDSIMDLAGNHLDGESGARAPFEGNNGLLATPPIFPTGDGVPGGDFVARFTVDSRPEIGTWGAGNVWIDTNGNFHFDPENVDYVNRDIVYKLGFTSDDVFSGDFSLRPGDTTDGYDKLAVYGRHEGRFRWLVDTDNDGVPNIDRVDPNRVNGLPFAGRFDNNDANGDEVGVFDGSTWYFDTNHDFKTDYSLNSFLVGYPVIGDFDGDGFDDLGTYADDTFMMDFANGTRRGWDGKIDQKISFGFIGVRERPVAADMDQDGFDDLGLWTPDREGVTDRDISEWYFLISNGASLLDRLSPQDDPVNTNQTIDFTPIPFGADIYARWGDEFARPVVGNFDPPTREIQLDVFNNSKNSVDVNNDGFVSPSDALAVINDLIANGSRRLLNKTAGMMYIDVNDDGHVSPSDALRVINYLNDQDDIAEGERDPLSAMPSVEIDNDTVFAIIASGETQASRIALGSARNVELSAVPAVGQPVDLASEAVELVYGELRELEVRTRTVAGDDFWDEMYQ
jgi:hypothetical protein